jgi:hypothetical protein
MSSPVKIEQDGIDVLRALNIGAVVTHSEGPHPVAPVEVSEIDGCGTENKVARKVRVDNSKKITEPTQI